MTDDFKADIRERAGLGGEVSYIYRGNELPGLADELVSGEVEGTMNRVWTSTEPVMRADGIEGMEVGEIPFLQQSPVPVTGGFSDSLAQTHNFNGRDNTSVVLDASQMVVSPVGYDYEYFTQNPGVYAHVRSSIAAEVRHQTQELGQHDLGGLIGFTKTSPRSARDTTIVETVDRVELDGTGLPGTSTNSLIAREREWVATLETVSISQAVEGVVTVEEELGIRAAYTRDMDIPPMDAPDAGDIVEEVHQTLNEQIPHSVPHWLIVVDSIGDATDREPEAWPVSAIDHAVSPSGEKVPPSDVPPKFRGVNV